MRTAVRIGLRMVTTALACEEHGPAVSLASRNLLALNRLPPGRKASRSAYASAIQRSCIAMQVAQLKTFQPD